MFLKQTLPHREVFPRGKALRINLYEYLTIVKFSYKIDLTNFSLVQLTEPKCHCEELKRRSNLINLGSID